MANQLLLRVPKSNSVAMFDVGSAPPKHDPPASMEPYDIGKEGDLGALSNSQQAATNRLKTETRINNEQYLRKHPEIKYMITAFLRNILTSQPEDAREYFAEYFTRNDLVEQIEKIKAEQLEKYHEDSVIRSLAAEDLKSEL